MDGVKFKNHLFQQIKIQRPKLPNSVMNILLKKLAHWTVRHYQITKLPNCQIPN